MKEYYGHPAFIAGVLTLGILQGVYVVVADTNKVMYKATGSFLDLTVKYPKDIVSVAEWRFNGKLFAEYSKSQAYSQLKSQFTGRIKEDNDKVGVTVQDLQLQDSGTFSVVIDGTERQYPTEEFTVYIQNLITAMNIMKNRVWKVSTNSCDVDVKCAAIGAESVTYQWSGYKTASGAQLQFSLSPAEDAVTLNCTAANNVSSITATETLSCTGTNDPSPGKQENIPHFVWIAITGGAALLLLIAVVAALSYWWRSRKDGSVADIGTTVYADVSNGATAKKDCRSDSINNGMTVYETVDDLRMNSEMTIYAKVTLPQHADVRATTSSPYQQVC